MSSTRVQVRFFAAACAAAGVEEEMLTLSAGASVADAIAALGNRGGELVRVLGRCSFLLDGVAVRDPATALRPGQTLDVLPPFAGG